ncbi:OLC1v1036456C1 [Oldenlandia corymbosa var. corymbosa]|uniref:OLC1v1036456C1 n=1 Tax=Oldenlandia corymbosa var. corymbosa TaxID=529605 RepID=A0AAV1CVW9_OLDCO|nr:OLC1v1036456C1 [Oldenlandia corymbosa var. corymbosa]
MAEMYVVKFDEELAKAQNVKPTEMLDLLPDFDESLYPHGPPGHFSRLDQVLWWVTPHSIGIYSSSNVFCFHWGLMTPTLLDVAVITGVPVIADVNIDGDSEGPEAAKAGELQQRRHGGYIKENMHKDGDDLLQHIRFLPLWLNRYIICGKSFQMTQDMYHMTAILATGKSINMCEIMLAILFHSMQEISKAARVSARYPFFDVAFRNTWQSGREKMTVLDYYERKEMMNSSCRSGKIVPFEIVPEVSGGFLICIIGANASDNRRKEKDKRKKAADPTLPVKRRKYVRLTGQRKTSSNNSKQKCIETIDLSAEESDASGNKQTLESLEEDAGSSPEQHASPPSKQKCAASVIPSVEELQQRLSKKVDDPEPEVKTSGKPAQSVGAALRVLQGLYKISAEQVHARYHQPLKEALGTICESDLQGAVKATVGLFLANFEQRKISCEICVKHVEDYNHSAMAHQKAEEITKAPVKQAVATTAQAKNLAEKQAALELELSSI